MNRNPVKSSNLKSMGYEQSTKTLEVEFNSGAVWRYFDVPPETYKAMQEAKSVGSFFSTTIRGKHQGAQVPMEQPKAAS